MTWAVFRCFACFLQLSNLLLLLRASIYCIYLNSVFYSSLCCFCCFVLADDVYSLFYWSFRIQIAFHKKVANSLAAAAVKKRNRKWGLPVPCALLVVDYSFCVLRVFFVAELTTIKQRWHANLAIMRSRWMFNSNIFLVTHNCLFHRITHNNTRPTVYTDDERCLVVGRWHLSVRNHNRPTHSKHDP